MALILNIIAYGSLTNATQEYICQACVIQTERIVQLKAKTNSVLKKMVKWKVAFQMGKKKKKKTIKQDTDQGSRWQGQSQKQ